MNKINNNILLQLAIKFLILLICTNIYNDLVQSEYYQDSTAPGFSGIVKLHNTLFIYLLVVAAYLVLNYYRNENKFLYTRPLEVQSNNLNIFDCNLVKMSNHGRQGAKIFVDLELQRATEKWLKEEALVRLNKPGLEPELALNIANTIIEELTEYHIAGGDLNGLSLYSLIDNKYYFKVIKEDIQENTDVVLQEPLDEYEEDDNSNNKGGPKGSDSGEGGGSTGLYLENKPNSNSSNFSILKEFLITSYSLFSNVLEFILEHYNNF
jgi:hypothetical protein